MVRTTLVQGGELPTQTDFDLCKGINHPWDRVDVPNLGPPQMGWRLSLRCLRCHSERHDLISPVTGEVMARRYIYTSGYIREGSGRPIRTELRLSMFEHWKEELQKTEQIANVMAEKTTRRRTKK